MLRCSLVAFDKAAVQPPAHTARASDEICCPPLTPLPHLALKAANLLLTEHLVVKVADFGVSRVLDEASAGPATMTAEVGARQRRMIGGYFCGLGVAPAIQLRLRCRQRCRA